MVSNFPQQLMVLYIVSRTSGWQGLMGVICMLRGANSKNAVFEFAGIMYGAVYLLKERSLVHKSFAMERQLSKSDIYSQGHIANVLVPLNLQCAKMLRIASTPQATAAASKRIGNAC